jgi:hypothetical protein
MPTGRGGSFGAALRALIDAQGGTYSTYQAKGWHAQLRELSGTERGRTAADAAGLSPSRRTYVAWLSEAQTPSAANRAKIAQAYERASRRSLPASMRSGTIEIRGQVAFGPDVRDRGAKGTAPLRVDASYGDWDEFATVWEAGATDEELEEAFIEEIFEAEFGETTETVEFGGGAYTISN